MSEPTDDLLSPWLLTVTVNDYSIKETSLLLQDNLKNLYADKATINAWGLLPPQNQSIMYRGKAYYNLNGYKGFTYTINKQELSAKLTFPVQYFQTNSATIENYQLYLPDKSVYGAFLNYNLFSTGPISQQSSVQNPTNNNALLSPTFFGPYGNITNQILTQQSSNSNPQSADNPLRLQSFYQIDFPSEMQSLIVGDSTTTPGMWGTSIAFGGITFQTNFGTQPYYTTFPLPAAFGTAVVPTSAELFINNNLVNTQHLNPGPFVINNIPVITGSGTINVLINSVTGEQQIISVPYYTSTSLLKPGLQNFSYQLGWARENYGIYSNDYGPMLGIVSDQIGVTPTLTLEGDIEASSSEKNVGVGAVYSFDNYFLLNSATAVSFNTLGNGALLQLGAQHQPSSSLGINYGINSTFTTDKFLQLAASPEMLSPSSQIQAFFSENLTQTYGINMSFTQIINRSVGSLYNGNSNFITIGCSANFLNLFSLSVTGSSNVNGQANKSIYLFISKSFNTNYNLNLSNNNQLNNPQSSNATINFSKNTPTGEGYGYNIQTTQNLTNASSQPANYQGTYNLNTAHADYTFGLANQTNVTSYQASINGALIYIGRHAYLSPPVQGAFTSVELGLPDINIYANNQLVGATNQTGNIIVPNLQAYGKNVISLDPNQLPINTQILSSTAYAIPYANEGMITKIPVIRIQAVVLNVYTKNKKPVPAGVTAYLKAAPEKKYYVGYDGQVYLPYVNKGPNTLYVESENKVCKVNFNFEGGSNAKNPITQMGKVICQ